MTVLTSRVLTGNLVTVEIFYILKMFVKLTWEAGRMMHVSSLLGFSCCFRYSTVLAI